MQPQVPVPEPTLAEIQSIFEGPDVAPALYPYLFELLSQTCLRDCIFSRVEAAIDPSSLHKTVSLFNPTRLPQQEQVIFKQNLPKDFIIFCLKGSISVELIQETEVDVPSTFRHLPSRFSRFGGGSLGEGGHPSVMLARSVTVRDTRSQRRPLPSIQSKEPAPRLTMAQKRIHLLIEGLNTEVAREKSKFNHLLNSQKRKARVRLNIPSSPSHVAGDSSRNSHLRSVVSQHPLPSPVADTRPSDARFLLQPGDAFGDIFLRGKYTEEALVVTALSDAFYLTISASDLEIFMLENRIQKVKKRKTFFIKALGLSSHFHDSKELDAVLSKMEVS